MGTGSSVTIGYQYYMGMHMVLCHGPVDAVNQIIAGERIIRGDGATNGAVCYDGINSIVQIAINKRDIFGGKRKEGGIVAAVDIMFGASDQAQNDYLLTTEDMTAQNLPHFRGVVSCVIKKGYLTAMTPYIKPWWFKIKDIPGQDWYAAKAIINETGESWQRDASANPAHILYDTLTNTEWGLGYSNALLDDASFKAAADTLYDEHFGMSLILTGQDPVVDFVQEVLRHINGVIYTSRTNGKFTLKLFRDDYSIPALPVFDESNILELNSYQRPSFAEMINEVQIVYRKRGETKDTTLTFQDPSSIDIQGGTISQTIQFPGIDSAAIAEKVGQRELKQHSTPLATMELIVNRDGWDINPGDPIVLNWPTLGIDTMVLRVVTADYGEILKGEIKLACIEDIFGLPSVSYLTAQDPIWTDPIQDPVAITESYITEATYYEIHTGFPNGDLASHYLNSTTSYLIYMGTAPVAAPNYQIWAKGPSWTDYVYRSEGDFTPSATLINAITQTDTTDIQMTVLPYEVQNVEVGSYAFFEGTTEEIVRIDAIDTVNNRVTIGRGCIDTIPAAHAAGTRLWFGKDLWGVVYRPFDAETINVKARTQTGTGLLELADATTESVTFVGRAYKPYPVANVTFGDNDWSFPAEMYGIISGSPGIRLKWVDRNRLTQTVPIDLIDWFDGNVTIESGVTYDLYLYGELDLYRDSNPSRTVAPAGGNQYDWTTEIADSGLLIYDPVGFDNANPLKHPTIHASLGKNEVYRSGTTTVFTGYNNITYDGSGAVFNGVDSYIDVCNAVGGERYRRLSLIFNPVDTGNAEQSIIAYYGDNSQWGFGPLMSISWKRSTHAVLLRVAANYGDPNEELLGYARPGVNNEIYVEWTDSIESPPEGGVFAVWMNGRSIPITAGSSGTNIIEKPIVLGCGWNIDESTRENFYAGSMTDLRIWRPTVPDTIQYTDIWDTTRNRANRSFRARIVTERVADSVTSLQTFDYIVPQRYGWGLNWGNKWDGRF